MRAGEATKTLWDLGEAKSLAEAMEIWPHVEIPPAFYLILLVALGGIYIKFFLHSPLDRREARPGSFYLGNIQLGQNPKADGNGPIRTRLSNDPDYVPDDPPPKRLRR